jgi:hypothetical protein
MIDAVPEKWRMLVEIVGPGSLPSRRDPTHLAVIPPTGGVASIPADLDGREGAR